LEWNQLEVTVKELIYETKVKYTQTYWLQNSCEREYSTSVTPFDMLVYCTRNRDEYTATTQWQTKNILANCLALYMKHVSAKPETDTICYQSYELHSSKRRAIAAYGSQWQPVNTGGWVHSALICIYFMSRIGESDVSDALLALNLLKTERRPLYLKAQSVPRCKHFSSRL
jgi:hypothetical protein